jgi:hypothetical protein
VSEHDCKALRRMADASRRGAESQPQSGVVGGSGLGCLDSGDNLVRFRGRLFAHADHLGGSSEFGELGAMWWEEWTRIAM